MTPKLILEYCLQKKGAFLAFPFGEKPICTKVANRIFLELYPEEDDFKITVCCEPFYADLLRQQYPEIVVPGYHCPPKIRRCKNTIYVDKVESEAFVFEMIDHSYSFVMSKLRKYERDAVMNS